jgi:hypothetical protein
MLHSHKWKIAMQIITSKIGFNAVIIVRHSGQPDIVLDLVALGVDTKTMNALPSTFHFTNKHIYAKLRPEIQTELFLRFKQCVDRCDHGGELDTLITDLNALVAHMYSVVDVGKIETDIATSQLVYVPRSIQSVFTPDISIGTPEQTYLVPDYINLVSYSLVVKLMIPIWLKFFQRCGSETGRGHRERWAFSLLRMAAITKLHTYIQHQYNNSGTADRLRQCVVTLGGQQVVEMTLSWVTIQLIAYISADNGDVQIGLDGIPINADTSTPITRLFYAVRTQVESGPASSRGIVHPKFPDSSAMSDTRNSLCEEFRAINPVSGLDTATANVAVSDRDRLLRQMYRGKREVTQADYDLLKEVHASVSAYENHEKGFRPRMINDCQIYVAFWLLGRTNWREACILPPNIMPHMQHDSVMNIFAVVITYLWQNGFKEIAALISAKALTHHMGGLSTGCEKIKDQKIHQILDEKFKAAVFVGGKKKRDLGAPNTARQNRIVVAIDQLVQPAGPTSSIGFASNTWQIRLPRKMIAEVTGHADVTTYAAPKDIRTKLAQLVISLFA